MTSLGDRGNINARLAFQAASTLQPFNVLTVLPHVRRSD
jgi:hypothetical protein